MTVSIAIPTTTLPVGAHSFGPATVNSTDTQATININPQVPGGLDAVTSAVLDIVIEGSTDGGVTWHELAGASGVQGPVLDHHTGLPAAAWDLGVTLPGQAFQVRGTVTVHNAAVAIGGSVVIGT